MGIRGRKGHAGTMALAILAPALAGCTLEPITLEEGAAAQQAAKELAEQHDTVVIETWPNFQRAYHTRGCRCPAP